MEDHKIWLIWTAWMISVIGCISLRMERVPLKTFKPKEFLESISPKVLLTDINKTQRENGENSGCFHSKI